MLRQALLSLSENRFLNERVLTSSAARRAASRFVAGDTLERAVPVVRRLNAEGMTASLDLLGEKTSDQKSARLAGDQYVTILRTIAREHLDCNVSLKLTQLGLDVDPGLCEASLRALLDVAREVTNFIHIDMESSAYVNGTLALYRRLRADGVDHVGVVLQSYLYRTESDLETLLPLRPRIRLVKGAYAEPPAVAYPQKSDVDAKFRALTERLLPSAPGAAIATHDPRLIEHTKAFARSRDIPPDAFEFQMLYGIRRDLQRQIRDEGYRLRVYVPFGTQWFPYFMRRLAERPANVKFVLRSVLSEWRGRREG